MTRLPDWRERVMALIEQRFHQPFAWGENDCALFAADAVQAMTGTDPAEHLRGMTARQAMRFVRDAGGLAALTDKILGPHVLVANLGDIVLVNNSDRDLLGVYNGRVALAPGRRGLVALPIAAACVAWSI